MENELSISELIALPNYAKERKEKAPSSTPSITTAHTWDSDIQKLESRIATSYQMATRKLFNRY